MFENLSSRIGTGGRSALRLEALEDRSTPAVIGLTTPTLSALSQTGYSAVDRMFVSDAARFSVLESWLGGLIANRAGTATAPQVQALGQQLATVSNAAFVQELPLLVQSGLSLTLTPTDAMVIADLPTLNGATGYSQILLTSAVIQIQQVALFQAEAAFGTNTAARGFAQNALPVLQSQLQTTLSLLGQTGTATPLGFFNQVGQFGTASVLGASGMLGTGVATTLNSALGTSFFFPTTFSNATTLGAFGTTSSVGFFPQVGSTTFGGGGTPGTFGATNAFGFSTFGGGTPGTFGSTGPFGFGT